MPTDNTPATGSQERLAVQVRPQAWLSPERPDGLYNLNVGDRMIAAGLGYGTACELAVLINRDDHPAPAQQPEPLVDTDGWAGRLRTLHDELLTAVIGPHWSGRTNSHNLAVQRVQELERALRWNLYAPDGETHAGGCPEATHRGAGCSCGLYLLRPSPAAPSPEPQGETGPSLGRLRVDLTARRATFEPATHRAPTPEQGETEVQDG